MSRITATSSAIRPRARRARCRSGATRRTARRTGSEFAPIAARRVGHEETEPPLTVASARHADTLKGRSRRDNGCAQRESNTQLPGVFGDLQPLLEHYGYLAVGGFVLLEDFGVPAAGVAVLGAIIGDNIGFPVGHLGGWQPVERICTWAGLDYLADENIVEIYAAFERYKWYVIAAIALIATILITRRVRRTRLGRRLVRL